MGTTKINTIGRCARAMSRAQGKTIEQTGARAHGRWIIVAVIVLLLAAAGASQGRPGDIDRNYNDHADDDEDDEEENATGPVGASRGLGGTNRTWDINEFPWIYVLFSDPKLRARELIDRNQVGFALELTHDIFLAHASSIGGSSLDRNWSDLMDMRRAKEIKFVNPGEYKWGARGKPLGRWQQLLELEYDFYIYRLTESDRTPPPWREIKTGSSRQWDGPKPIDPRMGEFRYYPYVNKDKNLAKNCYLYTFSAIDWPEVSKFLVDKAMPPPTVDRSNWTYQADELRYFTRWPVKLVNGCKDFLSRCTFVFDKERYIDEHMEEKYNAQRAQVCGIEQDAGAPILCGEHDDKIYHNHNPKGHYFERRNLLLSYIVLPKLTDREHNTTECRSEIWAWRLADKAEQIWEKLQYYNNIYMDEYRTKDPKGFLAS